MNLETPEVPAVKDYAQRPIPSAWRPVIRQIVDAFVEDDYELSGIAGVRPVSAEDASRSRDYVKDYGETLVALPDETWDSSVCIWTGNRWEALIDLWTLGEGPSDLVLNLEVYDTDAGFVFGIHMVYVP